jgi:hypothetical protein
MRKSVWSHKKISGFSHYWSLYCDSTISPEMQYSLYSDVYDQRVEKNLKDTLFPNASFQTKSDSSGTQFGIVFMSETDAAILTLLLEN